MKETPNSYLLLAALMTLNSLGVPCAYADTKAKKQGVPTRTVRVTTGIEAVQGWEQGLVRGNPNLARWHWDPIYSYKQGYAKLPVQTAKPDTAIAPNQGYKHAPTKATYQYPVENRPDDRPGHLPFSPQAMEEVKARYSEAKMPQAPMDQPSYEERVNAKLTQPVQSEPTTATYGRVYSRKENVGTSLKYNSQQTAVYGQLLNNKQKSSYNVAKAKKKK